MASKV